MKVMKFGGTSVGKPSRMKDVAVLITKDNEDKIVVLSALSGTTNSLVQIGEALASNHKSEALEIIADLKKQYIDYVSELLINPNQITIAHNILNEHFEFLQIITKISYSEALFKDIVAQGELLSTKIFSIYLTQINVEHALLSALDFMTIDQNDEPQVGSIKLKLAQQIKKNAGHKIYITQGFICKNSKGEIDNLKRGGSDYTASLIAAACTATVCEIWTDIDGMHNNDPRVVKNTIAVEKLSFNEAEELAYFGAKILHPASIWPAQFYNIPVKLLNTQMPDAKGTIITDQSSGIGVKAVAAKDGITAINIRSSRMLLAYGFLKRIFEVFEKYKTSIDMVTTSEVAVSLTIDNNLFLNEIVKELELFGEVSVDHNQTIVVAVGHEIVSSENVVNKLFAAVDKIPIRMISYGGSKHNISILIQSHHKINLLEQLNKYLFQLN